MTNDVSETEAVPSEPEVFERKLGVGLFVKYDRVGTLEFAGEDQNWHVMVLLEPDAVNELGAFLDDLRENCDDFKRL